MQILATTAQMKQLDHAAIEGRGILSLELMERAAQGVVRAVLRLLEQGEAGAQGGVSFSSPMSRKERAELQKMLDRREGDRPRAAVFCGPGNNGGDGIAAARLLLDAGCEVRTFLVGDRGKMTADARAMEQRLLAAGGLLEPFVPGDRGQLAWLSTCACAVDALFGVGLRHPVAGDFLEAVRMMNRAFCPVVACDIPSGVDGDTGEILGEAVRARVTVTFTCAKPGLYLGEGGPCAGEVEVASIGIPEELVWELTEKSGPRVRVIESVRGRLPRRPATAHKGDFGRVFILAGCEGYTGAPVLCARAAVRTGAGLVFLGVPREIYPITAVKCDEAMPFPLPETYDAILEKARGCDVALIGPGLGRAPETEELVLSLLADLDVPVVLDADGINGLSGHIDRLDRRSAPTILTPHDGEFQRLTGCALPIHDRLSAAREFARAHGCVLVLKGHNTITAGADGSAWINTTGNPGMAKGGSGDVLAGMLAALLGQKQLCPPETDLAALAAFGVYCHGLAGDWCARKLGEYAMTASDLIAALPKVLKPLEARGQRP